MIFNRSNMACDIPILRRVRATHYAPTVVLGNVFSWERADCSVVAISVALNIPYSDAHTFLRRCGRKDKEGVFFARLVIPHVSTTFGVKTVVPLGFTKGMTLNQMLTSIPWGTYIALKRSHVFCVKAGPAVFDRRPVGLRTPINQLWKIE